MRQIVQPYEAVIKWSGSKRAIAPLLALILPPTPRYFEPFVGGGAMLPLRPSPCAVAGDVIPELIALWISIRDEPDKTANEYEMRWQLLQQQGHHAYYKIRDAFNKTRNPHDLLFLTRTCVNGLIRFNTSGDFNNSLHHTRPGIVPARLREIISRWSATIQKVEFVRADYRTTLVPVKKDDLVFLDPPYAGTRGRYLPTDFDLQSFFQELERLNHIGAKWILTFDGHAGERDYNLSFPKELYQTKLLLPTGNSPFTKLMGSSIDAVFESTYLNFQIPTQIANQFLQYREQKLGARPKPDWRKLDHIAALAGPLTIVRIFTL